MTDPFGFVSSLVDSTHQFRRVIEIGVRLQGLGGRAAPPTTLLMGDLCLARGSRLLADDAPLAVQVAFARAIESVAAAAASEEPALATRQLLQSALGASR